jgi:hypothetical protein
MAGFPVHLPSKVWRLHSFLLRNSLYYYVPAVALFLWCAWRFGLYGLGLPLTDDLGRPLR